MSAKLCRLGVTNGSRPRGSGTHSGGRTAPRAFLMEITGGTSVPAGDMLRVDAAVVMPAHVVAGLDAAVEVFDAVMLTPEGGA